MKLGPASVVMVVGQRGEGKSYWIDKHIVEVAERVIIWSPHVEGRRPDYGGAERMDLGDMISDPETIAKREAYKIAVVGGWKTTIDVAEDFGDFCECCQAVAEYRADDEEDHEIPFVLVIDEAGVLLTPIVGKVQAWIWLETLATQSRHWGWGVPLVIASQRATQIRPSARTQADTVVSFRQPPGKDVVALVESCGEGAEQVSRLDMYKAWIWNRRVDSKRVRSDKQKQR